MLVGKEDLGLALSLGYPQYHHSLHLNPKTSLIPSPADSSSSTPFQKSMPNHVFSPSDPNSESSRAETRSFLRGLIDVNSLPCSVDCEGEAGASSPNSAVSSASGKRSEREVINGDEIDIERVCSRVVSDEEDGDASRKKLRLSKDQSAILEESFKEHSTLNPKQKMALANQLGLRPRQVEVWFQNRRARTKLKQNEVDCEFLKRCCENLTEENRRLQKEVQELRALKLSPPLYMQMTPPTTLTMCPSCASSTVEPKSHQLPQNSVPINPWPLAVPVPHAPFDAFRPPS
ncbi:hypothetical protein V6N13_097581 [Hibiscus sabdariffa]|uniref:Homeobox domain-containing protein n=1 Tax=Hibiscus sabdariffa TaxID=183260 RepID=A0ABR2BUM6_9ROSI